MSYILEALRKSEQERQRSKLPSIHTDHLAGSGNVSMHLFPAWIKWLGMITLLGAGIAGGLFWIRAYHPAQPETASLAGQQQGGRQAMPEPVRASIHTPSRQSEPTASSHTPAASPDPASPPEAAYSPDNIVIPKRHARTQAGSTMQSPATEVPSRQQPASPASQAIPSIPQLPGHVQQALPAINIAGHIYAEDPASRLVMINGNITHAGDSITPELTLESITPNGIILVFRGIRFHMGVFERWSPKGQ